MHGKEGLLYDVHCLHFRQNYLSSKYVQRSEIEKHGTAQDKANLPQATARNQADKRRRVFTIVGDARPNGRIRLNKLARATQRRNLEREALVDAFEGAFGVQ